MVYDKKLQIPFSTNEEAWLKRYYDFMKTTHVLGDSKLTQKSWNGAKEVGSIEKSLSKT
jgi:hypothetical protein